MTEQTPQLRTVEIGNITIILNNVAYFETIDRVNDETGDPEKVIWMYYNGGRNQQLYVGDPKTADELHEVLVAATGMHLNLNHMIEKEKEPLKQFEAFDAIIKIAREANLSITGGAIGEYDEREIEQGNEVEGNVVDGIEVDWITISK